jgi:hypothetical protein
VAFRRHAARRYLQRTEEGIRNKKLVEFARWQKQGGYLKTCQICQDIWKQVCRDLAESHPFGRCDGCPAVVLEPGNHTAWDVYQRVWNQVIVAGLGTVIGVQLEAVYRVMETLEIPKERHMDTIDKVSLMHAIIFAVKKKGESE